MPDQEPAVQDETATLDPSPAPPLVGQTPAQAEVKVCDFRQPSLLSAAEMRKLRARHDDFIRSLATRLSIYFRLEFSLKLQDLQTQLYPRFIQSLPPVSHISAFKVAGLNGTGLVDFSPRFAMTLLDRMLGGVGTPLTLGREMTELEVAVLDHAVALMLSEWAPGIFRLAQNSTQINAHETNPRFLQTAAEDTSMLVLSMEAQMGEIIETIRITCPFSMFESVLRELTPVAEVSKLQSTPAPQAPLQWNSRLDEIKVPLSATWSDIQVKAEKLARLQPGDVLPLSPTLFNNVQVRLARIPKFVGCLGQANERWAVEVQAPAKTQL